MRARLHGPPAEAPPELDAVLDHLVLRRLRGGGGVMDLGLDKKSVKARFDRKRLNVCSAFLFNAPDSWLAEKFRVRLDDETWRSAMGPQDEKERLRYLAGRVSAELMRVTGIGP